MSQKLIMQFIREVETVSTKHAEDAMLFPKSDPFEYGVTVGTYHGLQTALKILDSIMRGDEEKERQS